LLNNCLRVDRCTACRVCMPIADKVDRLVPICLTACANGPTPFDPHLRAMRRRQTWIFFEDGITELPSRAVADLGPLSGPHSCLHPTGGRAIEPRHSAYGGR